MPRPPGLPKTGGRKKGVSNKVPVGVKRHVTELAQEATVEAMAALVRIAKEGKSESAQIAAITLIFDRAYGKVPNVEAERVPQITAIQIGPNRLNGNGLDDAPPIKLGPFRRTV